MNDQTGARGGGAKKAGDLLKGLMADVGTRAARSDLADALADAVGPTRAPHCEVLGFRAGRLQVGVDSAPLHAEMVGFLREDIRQQINEKLPKRKVARVDFRLTGGSGS